MASPENIRPSTLPTPPFEVVSILMFGVIQAMAPLSVIMVSPASSVQITTGNGVPSILYCIATHSFFHFSFFPLHR